MTGLIEEVMWRCRYPKCNAFVKKPRANCNKARGELISDLTDRLSNILDDCKYAIFIRLI